MSPHSNLTLHVHSLFLPVFMYVSKSWTKLSIKLYLEDYNFLKYWFSKFFLVLPTNQFQKLLNSSARDSRNKNYSSGTIRCLHYELLKVTGGIYNLPFVILENTKVVLIVLCCFPGTGSILCPGGEAELSSRMRPLWCAVCTSADSDLRNHTGVQRRIVHQGWKSASTTAEHLNHPCCRTNPFSGFGFRYT